MVSFCDSQSNFQFSFVTFSEVALSYDMTRRKARLVVSPSRARPSNAEPGKEWGVQMTISNQAVERCIEECLQCLRWCAQCRAESLNDDPVMMRDCIRLCNECLELCRTCVAL